MPSLNASCHATFGGYSWDAWSFMKENGGGEDLGEKKRGRPGKDGGRENCGQEELYAKKKKNK